MPMATSVMCASVQAKLSAKSAATSTFSIATTRRVVVALAICTVRRPYFGPRLRCSADGSSGDRHTQHGVERWLWLAVSAPQQRIVRSTGNRIPVLPRHSIVHTPEGDTVDLVALAIKQLEKFAVAIGELPLNVVGQHVRIRIEERLELLELELLVAHHLANDLPFPR